MSSLAPPPGLSSPHHHSSSELIGSAGNSAPSVNAIGENISVSSLNAAKNTTSASYSSSVYSFVAWTATILMYVCFLLWALLPKWMLHSVGVTYYPSRYYALALPSYALVLYILLGAGYVGLNLLNTLDPEDPASAWDAGFRGPSAAQKAALSLSFSESLTHKQNLESSKRMSRSSSDTDDILISNGGHVHQGFDSDGSCLAAGQLAQKGFINRSHRPQPHSLWQLEPMLNSKIVSAADATHLQSNMISFSDSSNKQNVVRLGAQRMLGGTVDDQAVPGGRDSSIISPLPWLTSGGSDGFDPSRTDSEQKEHTLSSSSRSPGGQSSRLLSSFGSDRQIQRPMAVSAPHGSAADSAHSEYQTEYHQKDRLGLRHTGLNQQQGLVQQQDQPQQLLWEDVSYVNDGSDRRRIPDIADLDPLLLSPLLHPAATTLPYSRSHSRLG